MSRVSMAISQPWAVVGSLVAPAAAASAETVVARATSSSVGSAPDAWVVSATWTMAG